MEQEHITYFLALYGRYYPEEKISELIDKLKAMPDASFEKLNALPKKDPLLVLTYSLFLGYFGVERMMIGQTGKGLLKFAILGCMCILAYFIDDMAIGETAKWVFSLLALAIGCIWVFVDWSRAEKMTKIYNYKEIIKLFNTCEIL